MFVVKLENGTILKEGVDIANWGEVPVDVSIESVSLTDYGQLLYTMSGQDFYIVVTNAQASISTEGGGVARQPIVTAQTLYGIQNPAITRPHISRLTAKLQREIGDIAKIADVKANHAWVKIRAKLDTDVDRRMKSLLAMFDANAVTSVSMGFTTKMYSRAELTQDEKGFRAGKPRAVEKPTLDFIEEFLLKPVKKVRS